MTMVEEICRLLAQTTGIQLGEKQYHMVESKLARRMFELGIAEPRAYLAHLRQEFQAEMNALVSLLTTHHTFFFREFFHFEYLERHALPKLVATLRKEGRNVLRVWSAACSRGQETYSLSMCLSAWLRANAPDLRYEILSTDIDTESVSFARNGVYRWEEIKEIPLMYLGTNWVRGTGDISDFVKAKPSIKGACKFATLNLLDFAHNPAVAGQRFDLIFCRNVFIYFSGEQIAATTRNLMEQLAPEGLLFLGVSETLTGHQLPVEHLGHSVYSRKRPAPALVEAPAAAFPPVSTSAPRPAPRPLAAVPASPIPAAAATAGPAAAAKLRVMCVDDSPVVLTLLKKFLSAEFGFEVVATAQNGLDAAEKLKTVKVDVMTLDIHMPEQNGLEYLKARYGAGHPPVVIVSSVNRENADLAIQCLELGASDYVEKPAFADLAGRGDEIRAKLRCAARPERSSAGVALSRSFASSLRIERPETTFRLLVAPVGDYRRVQTVLDEAVGPQPPTVVLFTAADTLVAELAGKLRGSRPFDAATVGALRPGERMVGTVGAHLGNVRSQYSRRRASIQLFGALTRELLQSVRGWSESELSVEDLKANVELVSAGHAAEGAQVVPSTSFAYVSDLFLAKGKGGKP